MFSEAAQQGSFAAARELGLSSSAVVKGIARLELSLRVRLFHRTARSIRLTQPHRGCILGQRRRASDTRNELVIFLTPRIVNRTKALGR